MTRSIAGPILDYRPPHPDDRRVPAWLLRVFIAAAVIAFPFLYALFAIVLILTPLLLLASWTTALVAIAACALTAAATFGSLHAIDRCLARACGNSIRTS
jgi:hypothetical protein